jgi:DNA-binding transcriptional MocR family regulator
MSIEMTDWAWKQALPLGSKCVLVFLADRHNGKTGQCNPKIETIAEATGQSRSSVKRALHELQELGLLTIEPTVNPKTGGKGTNRYSLAGAEKRKPTVHSEPYPTVHCEPGYGPGVNHPIKIEPEVEPPTVPYQDRAVRRGRAAGASAVGKLANGYALMNGKLRH